MASENPQPSYSKGCEKESVLVPLKSESSQNNATKMLVQTSKYRYSHLPEGNIRLLRLLPDPDKTTSIQCALVYYPLQGLLKSSHHLYDALSYAWGSSKKTESISIDNCDLPITVNLHAALSRLRDCFFERIIWVDAICINQEDSEEQGRQVQSMAMIYNMARRVIVWLGESEADSEQALQEIHKAADVQPTKNNQIIQHAVLKLLQRPWFKRIWVLQEVAAARNVLIICGSLEIDGYVFCSGIYLSNLTYKNHPDLQSLIRPATYLIQRTVFRPKETTNEPGRFSLNIRSLAELIDMYHTREASNPLDKVYALLGMSSDNYSSGGLYPDYDISWGALFQKVIKFILGEQESIITWDDKEVAVIKSKGYALGQVSSVTSESIDKQNVTISESTSGYLGQKEDWNGHWTLQASAKSIQKGDIVCLLLGASKPTIVRLYEDYFSIIAIAITPIDDNRTERESNDWPDILRLITDSPRDFLLVWDWKQSSEHLGNEDHKRWINSQVLKNGNTDLGSWLMSIGLILEDLKIYEEAAKNIERAIENYIQKFGDEHLHTRAAIRHLASIYIKKNRLKEGKNLEVIEDLLIRRGDYNQITENGMMQLATLFDQGVMTILLDRRGSEVIITEKVVQAVARNRENGEEIMILLLSRQGDQVTITEEAVSTIAREFNEKVMTMLLDRRGDQVAITEKTVSIIAAKFGERIMTLLLDRRGDQVTITEKAVSIIAAKFGEKIMTLLLDRRGDQVTITEEVIKAAAGNQWNGYRVIALLLDRRGDQITITEEVVKAAVGNIRSGYKIMVLLLDRRGDQITITEEVVKAAAGNLENDMEVMALLLDRRREEVVKAAAACGQDAVVKRLLFRRNSVFSN